jgi:uncharacterized Tic20 family protein
MPEPERGPAEHTGGMSETPYATHSSPNAQLTPGQERSWAVATHVITGTATFMSAGTLGFVAALVVYLTYKDRGPFVRRAAANAMNIQVNGLLWAVAITIFGVLTFGFGLLLLFAIPLVMIVLHALDAWENAKGEWYDPPFTIRFVS